MAKFLSVDADTFSKPISGSDEPQQGGWFRTFTIAAYKPYFDVDTTEVLERIKDSLFPFRGTFTEKTANNPDLWVIFSEHGTLIYGLNWLECQIIIIEFVRNFLLRFSHAFVY